MIDAFRSQNLKITLGESLLTGVAATLSVFFDLHIWAMFVGWIAYFTRGQNWRNAIINTGCVFIGLLLGIGAATALGSLGRPPEPPEIFLLVSMISVFVLSTRFLPCFNNLLAIFPRRRGLVRRSPTPEPECLSHACGRSRDRQRRGMDRA